MAPTLIVHIRSTVTFIRTWHFQNFKLNLVFYFIGPPIIIPIGALLETGNVLLNDGIEIEGIFWESEDRILHPNGTIEYKLTGKSEKAKIAFGTVDDQGKIQLLPKLGKHKTSLSLFKVIKYYIPI